MSKLPERLNFIQAIENPELRIEIAARVGIKEVFGNRFENQIEDIEVSRMPKAYLLSFFVRKRENADILNLKIKELENRITYYSKLNVKTRIVMIVT